MKLNTKGACSHPHDHCEDSNSRSDVSSHKLIAAESTDQKSRTASECEKNVPKQGKNFTFSETQKDLLHTVLNLVINRSVLQERVAVLRSEMKKKYTSKRGKYSLIEDLTILKGTLNLNRQYISREEWVEYSKTINFKFNGRSYVNLRDRFRRYLVFMSQFEVFSLLNWILAKNHNDTQNCHLIFHIPQSDAIFEEVEGEEAIRKRKQFYGVSVVNKEGKEENIISFNGTCSQQPGFQSNNQIPVPTQYFAVDEVYLSNYNWDGKVKELEREIVGLKQSLNSEKHVNKKKKISTKNQKEGKTLLQKRKTIPITFEQNNGVAVENQENKKIKQLQPKCIEEQFETIHSTTSTQKPDFQAQNDLIDQKTLQENSFQPVVEIPTISSQGLERDNSLPKTNTPIIFQYGDKDIQTCNSNNGFIPSVVTQSTNSFSRNINFLQPPCIMFQNPFINQQPISPSIAFFSNQIYNPYANYYGFQAQNHQIINQNVNTNFQNSIQAPWLMLPINNMNPQI